MKTWKARKKRYLKTLYGGHAEQWAEMAKDGDINDDRETYVTVYEGLLEALDELPEEPHSFIQVAMDRYIREWTEALDRIIRHFDGVVEEAEE